jgi:uncharacterized protein (DUF488 family)
MEVYSIGFTRKTAEEFFTKLRQIGIRQLLDVRLRNVSQLAGFANGRDLPFFLRELCEASYVHEPLLAPTPEILDGYRKHEISWEEYERRFRALLMDRQICRKVNKDFFGIPTVLLCSEATADRCHRRLVLEHLQDCWGGLTVIHL